MKVIGMREVDRVSKISGKHYKALNLYVVFKGSNITGEGCEVLFLMKDNCYPGIAVGDDIKVSYNRFGNVEAVERVM